MTTFDTPNSTQTYTVPSGVSQIAIVANGAGGGDGGSGQYVAGVGASGGYVYGLLSVSGGDTFTVELADSGEDGSGGSGLPPTQGGLSPWYSGGDGGGTDTDVGYEGQGGGGGGATRVIRDSDSAIIAIAEGGGGGTGGGSDFSTGGRGGGGARGGVGYEDGGGTGGGGDGGAKSTGASAVDGEPGGQTAHTDLSSVTTTTGGGSAASTAASVTITPSVDWPTPGVAPIDSTEGVDLAWNDADFETGYEIHRSTSSGFTPDAGTQIATVGADTTEYLDSSVSDGSQYYYKVVATNSVSSATSGEHIGNETVLSAPSQPTLSVSGDDITASTSLPGNEDGVRYFRSDDGGSSWTQLNGTYSAGTGQLTDSGVLDGEEYVYYVTTTLNHARSESPASAPATTALPDTTVDSITPIDASVEDELTPRNADVADNGDVRYQIRVTGSGNAFGSDIVVPQGGSDATFAGLLDGEQYDIRARSETEHVTGTYVEVSDVTPLPAPSVTVGTVGTNSVNLSITDNADNEDAITVDRRRLYNGGYGPYSEIASLAPDTMSYTDSDVVPGTTYDYRVSNVTEHAESSTTVTTTTTAGAATNTTPRQSGWYIELTASDGNVRTFTSDGTPERDPSLKDLERVTVTVSKDESWQLPKWEDADARVWRDGARLPVDTLVGRQQRPGETQLVIEGPAELYESAEYEFTGDVHTAAADVLDDTSLPYTVVSPDAENRDFVTVDTEAEFQAYYQDPGGAEPVTVTPGGEIRPQQYCFPFEAEDNTSLSSATVSNSETAQMSDLSGNEGVNLVPSGSEVICEFTTERPIPGNEVRVNARIARTDFDGEQRLFIDGVLVGAFLVSTSLSEQTDWYDVTGGTTYVNSDTGESVNDIPDLAPGTHTFTMDTVTSYPGGNEVTASGYNVVDALALFDNRPPMLSFPNSTNANNVLEGPEVTKPLDITLLHDGFLSASGATFSGTFNDVSDAQAIALSNDYGATYLPSASGAANTSTLDVDFASPAPDIQLKVTLGAFGPDDVFPAGNSEIQALESYDIDIDARDSPPLSDDQFKGRRKDILTSLVNRGNILWAAEWDGDAQDIRIRVANVADFSGSRSLDLVDYQWDTETIGRQIESATITGGSQLVQNEPLTADEGVAVSLANDRLVTGREQVRATNGGTIYTRGSDYEIDYLNGTVTDLARGNISDGEALDVTYEFKPNASYSVGGADSRNELIQTFVGASSDAVCQSIAYYLVQELKDPVVGGTATVDKDSLPAGFSWLDLFAADPLPTDITDDFYVENGTVTQSEIRANLQSRKPTGDIISIVSESLGSVEDRV